MQILNTQHYGKVHAMYYIWLVKLMKYQLRVNVSHIYIDTIPM